MARPLLVTAAPAQHSVAAKAVGDSFWSNFVGEVRSHGGNISMHHRRGVRNRPGGYGQYSLTVMGPHRAYWYHQLCGRLVDAGMIEEEELVRSCSLVNVAVRLELKQNANT